MRELVSPPSREPFVDKKGLNSSTWTTWLFNLFEQVSSNTGAFITGAGITTIDSPYSMQSTDEVIYADPDTGTIRVDLLAGENGRLIRVKNVKTGAAASVDVYPNGSELIQTSAGTDPGAGPLTLSKGESVTLVYVATETAWLIL